MSQGPASGGAFSPRPDDDDDVRWALSTALVQWNRGGRADAVVWLRRAADAADESGAPARATELRSHAARIAESLWDRSAPEPTPTDDIEIEVDLESRPRAPLPPPPAAIRAAQARGAAQAWSGRPPDHALEPQSVARQSLPEADPEREHFASAPEIVLDEQSLDPAELEEILDYVGEDDVESAGEDSRASHAPVSVRATNSAVPSGRVSDEFSDRLSSAEVESISAESMLPYQEPVEEPLPPHSEDRPSDADAFELHGGTPSQRSPMVAFDEDEDFEDRITLVPESAAESASGPPGSGGASSLQVPRLEPLSGIGIDEEAPVAEASKELLDGDSALAIDADLDESHSRNSVDLGADWAPLDSAPPDSAPPDSAPPEETAAASAEEQDAEVAQAGTDQPSADRESVEALAESVQSELLPLDSAPPDAPDSLPALEFPSEPPASASAEPLEVVPGTESLPPRPSLPTVDFEEERATAPSVVGPSQRTEAHSAPPEPQAESLEVLGPVDDAVPTRVSEPEVPLQKVPTEPPAAPSEAPAAAPGPSSVAPSGQPLAPTPVPAARPASGSPSKNPYAEGSVIDGVDLMTTRGFEDLPEEVQGHLAQTARIETLSAGEEVGLFGAAIITNGQVNVMPAFADEAGATAMQSDVVFTRGTLQDSIALRVVAKVDDTRVAVWESKPLEAAIAECPWVHDELRMIADRFLALCGATLGPLGERLDESLRSAVFQRLEVRTFSKGETLTEEGEALTGLYVVGGGRVEVLKGDRVAEEKHPGDFLFAMAIMSGAKSPATTRAGEAGALALFAPRSVAHELMISVPPLLEVLAG